MAIQAKVNVQISIKSWQRLDDEPFRPTRNWTTTSRYVTDTSLYATATSGIGLDIYNQLVSLRATGALSTVLISTTVENVTAPVSGKGVVALPKQHIDFAFSDDEVTSANVVSRALNTKIADLIIRAKY